MPEPRPKRAFATLDGVRGVAAVCVMGFHYALLDRATPLKFSNAFIDVDLFFCLSGFVLMQAYGNWADTGRGIAAFLKGRIARLYPMYAAGTAVGVLTYLITASSYVGDASRTVLEVILALLMLPDLSSSVHIPFSISNTIYPFNVPAWSLFFEILANVALVTRRWSRMDLMLTTFIAAVGLVLVSVAAKTLNGGFEALTMPVGLFRVMYSFSMGATLMTFYQSGALKKLALPPFVPILSVVCISALVPANGKIDLVLVLIVLPLIIATATQDLRSRWGLSACAWLGRISYPLYMVHYPLVLLVLQFEIQHVSRAWVIAACAVLSVALSDLLARTLDPVLRLAIARTLLRRSEMTSA